TPEIQKAVEKGYRVVKIYEVWHFGPNQRREGLFAQYVNTFLKLKQEASGWPAEVADDPEKRQDYIANYRRHENIQLDPDKIEKNPGKRTTAKLMLNSFWGKFGEKPNKPKTVTITQPSQLYPYLFSSNFSLKNLRICTEDMTDELQGDVITEFVSGGAKNYGYKTRQGKTECKVRGFTLNVRGKQVLNFNTMKANILAEIEDPQEERRVIKVTNPNYFKRDTTHKTIKLVNQTKQYKMVFDKRVIDRDTKMTYPFGYRVLTEPDRENV
ncbi:unnamed protein product, partial [Porites evermanni]